MFRNLSLSTRFAIILLIAALAPVIMFSRAAVTKTTDALTTVTGSKFEALASRAMDTIDQTLYARKTDVETWASSPVFKELETDDAAGHISEQLASWKRSYGAYAALYVIDNAGKIIASSEKAAVGKSVVNEVWYKNARNPGAYTKTLLEKDRMTVTASIGDVEYDSISGSYGVNINAPVGQTNENGKSALLVSRLNWSELFDITNAIVVSKGAQNQANYAMLVNRAGQVLTGPGTMVSEGGSAEDVLFHKNLIDSGFQSVKKSMGGERGYAIEQDKDGTEVLVGFAGSKGYLGFEGLGWSVLVVQNTKDAFAATTELTHAKNITLIVSLLVAVLIAFRFGRSLRYRLFQVETYLHALRKGYLAERLPVASNDEVGGLAVACNEMADSLQRKFNDELEARKAAEAANRTKGEFLAEVGHEIRSPLNSMIEVSEALLGTNLSDDQRLFTSSIRKSACAAMAIANDIREIARIETGESGVHQKSFNLKHVIEEATMILSAAALHRGISLGVEYDSKAPAEVYADQVRIHQIFTNVLAHVLKFTSEDQVLVSVTGENIRDDRATIRVVVGDTGHGVSTDKIRRLMSSSKANGGQTETPDDVITELSTTKRMVELMGGELGNLKEADGKGTVIWLALPVRMKEHTMRVTDSQPQPGVS